LAFLLGVAAEALATHNQSTQEETTTEVETRCLGKLQEERKVGKEEEGGEGCTMGSCNQQSRLGVLCIAACVSVCILLAVPTVLCFATRVSLVEEEEGARGGGGAAAAAAATAIIQEKPLPFIVLHGKEVSSVSLSLPRLFLSLSLWPCVFASLLLHVQQKACVTIPL
jgi:hypothetical protein